MPLAGSLGPDEELRVGKWGQEGGGEAPRREGLTALTHPRLVKEEKDRHCVTRTGQSRGTQGDEPKGPGLTNLLGAGADACAPVTLPGLMEECAARCSRGAACMFHPAAMWRLTNRVSSP